MVSFLKLSIKSPQLKHGPLMQNFLEESEQFKEATTIIQSIVPNLLEEARMADKYNIFPESNFDLIKNAGLLGLIIPTQFGGFGLNFLQYQYCIALLANGCPSTASAFNMHCIVLGALADISFDKLNTQEENPITDYVTKIFSKVIIEKKVFASATTEPNIGSRYSKSRTTYEILEDGYLINGTKSFVTMAKYADYFSIIANKKNTSGEETSSKYLTFFVVPKEIPGIEIIDDWDTLGMRGTQSHRIVFDNVKLNNEHVFLGLTGFALIKIMKSPHWIVGGYCGVYVGIMEAALNFTIDYIKARSNIEEQSGLGYQTLIQSKIAQMHILYQHAQNSVSYAAKCVLHDPNSNESHRALYLAKYVVGENALKLTALAIKTCGGMSIQKKYDLERYFRDSRCAALMPAVSDACELFIGRNLLGISTDDIW